MSVQFILGRSGTGKTRSCVNAIVEQLCQGEQGSALVLLVPEQATYQAERMILSDRLIAGFSRLRVLSFDRLQFLLAGTRPGQTELSRIGEELLVHKILRSCRDRLSVYRDVCHTPGLACEMARVLGELRQADKQPEDMARLLANMAGGADRPQGAAKFADLKVVFDAYRQYLQDPAHALLHPDGQWDRVRKAIREAEWLRGAMVWVDGFAGFTAQEMGVLIAMIQVSSSSRIAMCLDPDRIDLACRDLAKLQPEGLFHSTERTYVQLLNALDRAGIEVQGPLLLRRQRRFLEAGDLAHLEECLSSAGLEAERGIRNSAAGEIRILAAPNRRAEIDGIAGRIMRLVRRQPIRYRDIAVIVSDLASYQPLIEAAFQDRGIPFFIDRPKSFGQHPLIELIRAALRVAVGGIETQEVMAFLKTGLATLTREEIYQLETYCLAYGIDKGPWLQVEPWDHADPKDFDSKAVDRSRRQAVRELAAFREGLCPKGAITATRLVAQVWALIEQLEVPIRLTRWCQEDPADLQGHRQVMEKLVRFLDEFTEIFGQEVIPVEDACSILDQALTRLTFKLIPPTVDQVLVGAIERSRHPEIKVAFLVGVTQRQFPVPLTFDKILTEEDRALARDHGLDLAATLEQDLSASQYLAYIAVTRPSLMLVLTYPLVDERGSAVTPSPLVEQVTSAFSGIAVGRTEAPSLDLACSVVELTDALSLTLGRDRVQDEGTWQRESAILAGLCRHQDPRLHDAGYSVLRALEYGNPATLSDALAQAAFGESAVSSVSRLTSFAACPFQHFAKYVLDLRPRPLFGLEPMDVGTFYHAVLDRLHRTLVGQGQDLKGVDDAALLALTDQLIDRQVQSDRRLAAFVARGRHQAFIVSSASETIRDCVRDLAVMSRAGIFGQAGSEVGFGPDGQIGPLELTLPAGRKILVQGRIDRVDVAGGTHGLQAIVMDYKRTAGGRFSWGEFFHGLDLQLPVYLLALRGKALGAMTLQAAVGAFIVPIEAPPAEAPADQLASTGPRFARKAKGFFHAAYAQALDVGCRSGRSRYFDFAFNKEGEPYAYEAQSSVVRPELFDRVLEHARTTMEALAERMVSGRIEIQPYRMGTYSPCGFCDYRPVCRFDWQINEYRPLAPLGKAEVLDRLTTDEQRMANSE